MADLMIDTQSAPGWRIEWHETLPSTQTAIEDRARTTDVHRLAIAARRQSAGRGRRGNDWQSPPGGLWISFGLETAGGPDPFLGLLLAEAVHRSIARAPGVDPDRLSIKWPNDLVTGGRESPRKWAGILATSSGAAEGTRFLFGVGANLALERSQLPNVGRPITSIAVEFGASPSPSEALPLILCAFDELLRADGEHGREASLTRLVPQVSTVGQRIRWHQAGKAHEGEAVGLEPSGALRVRVATGHEEILHSNEVEHLSS